MSSRTTNPSRMPSPPTIAMANQTCCQTDLRHCAGIAQHQLSTNALHTDDSSPVVDFWALALAQVVDPDLAR